MLPKIKTFYHGISIYQYSHLYHICGEYILRPPPHSCTWNHRLYFRILEYTDCILWREVKHYPTTKEIWSVLYICLVYIQIGIVYIIWIYMYIINKVLYILAYHATFWDLNFNLIIFTNLSLLGQDMTQSQFFKRSLTGFDFRVFLLLDKLPHQGWRTQSALLFTHSWRENIWIHTFPKDISAMWNAISLVQDLNSHRRIHFLQRLPLHHGHHLNFKLILVNWTICKM